MKKKIIYEQPLNDRIRNLLRIEHLLMSLQYQLKSPSEWDTRGAIDTIINVLGLINKVDLIDDLSKDLQRHTQTLERWQRTPQVDTDRVSQMLKQTINLIERLSAIGQPPIGNLTEHHLLTQVRQRLTITGGTCRCDLPGYYYWIQRNPKTRQTEMTEWLTPIEPIFEAIELDLYLIRNNAVTAQEIAMTGVYQSKLEVGANYQIIQVALPPEHSSYPEINGGKQRIIIRFMEQSTVEQRATPTSQDVKFELNYCML